MKPLFIATLLLCSSCEDPVKPSYVLDRPRVLAIRSQPVDLVPGASLTLDALVYAPAGAPATTYQWSWCPSLATDFSCAISEQDLAELLDPTGANNVVVDYALGSGAQAILAYPATPDLIEAACARAAIGREPGDGGVVDLGPSDGGATDMGDGGVDFGLPAGTRTDGGMRLTCSDSWSVNVLLTAAVGGDTVRATRELNVYWTTPTTTNMNPTIDALLPFSSDADGGVQDLGVSIDDDGGVALQASVPASASEVYTGRLPRPLDAGVALDGGADAGTGCGGDGGIPDGGCDEGPVYEALGLAWYVEGGTIDHATTTLPSAAVGTTRDFTPLESNRWVPASSDAKEMIIVIRDSRGGIGWLRRVAKAPAP